jgi:uncharacterized protein YbjT (DUF2867 family)
LRATQFFEFMGAIAQSSVHGQVVRASTAALQPIAADDVAAALTSVAVGPPLNGIMEVACPERLPLAEFVQRFMSATGDSREVIADPRARYYGAELDDASLTPGGKALIGQMRFAEWLKRSVPEK